MVYTEGVNETALSSDDDKRLQTFDKITTDPYGANVFKVSESENAKSMQSESDIENAD